MTAPQLFIDGVEVGSTIQATSTIALAGLSIVWGAPTVWDQPDPTTMTVELIDPTGDTLSTPYIGRLIELVHPTHGSLFAGRIATAPAEQRTVRIDDRQMEVWVRTLVCKDPTSLLRRRAVGPGVGGAWPVQDWFTQRQPALLAQVNDAFVEDIIVGTTDDQRAYAADDEVDILDMLQRTATGAGGVLAYDPRRKRITVVFIDVYDVGFTLAWEDPYIAIATVDAIPAGHLHVIDSTWDLTVEDAVDQVEYTYYNSAGDEVVLLENSSHYDPSAAGVRVAEFESDSIDVLGNEFYAERFASFIGNMADRLKHPPIRWRAAELPAQLAVTSIAGTEFAARHQQLHIYGSKWAHLQGSARQYMIGGRMSWDGQKWQHDFQLASHPEGPTTPFLSLEDLVTNPDAPLDGFHPTINLATLGWVQFGAD